MIPGEGGGVCKIQCCIYKLRINRMQSVCSLTFEICGLKCDVLDTRVIEASFQTVWVALRRAASVGIGGVLW